MASEEPVLPPVNSTTRMPGRSRPRASAPSIIASAIRSLYDPVGFTDSSLTSTSAVEVKDMLEAYHGRRRRLRWRKTIGSTMSLGAGTQRSPDRMLGDGLVAS